jgi:hypothetical protein
MTATLTQPRGGFFKGALPVASGWLYFLDATTLTPKAIYYDSDNTTPAPNPIQLDANGVVAQVYYGVGDYIVRLYENALNALPIFPDDYPLVREWFNAGQQQAVVSTTLATAKTMASLRTLAPVNGDQVLLTGYYSDGDKQSRMYHFVSSNTDTDNSGTRITPNGYSNGRWLMEEVDVIDASDFGAVPDSGINANGSIGLACTWCSTSGQTLHFSAGSYPVVGVASQNITCPLILDQGAYFTVSIGTYTIKPYDTWSIGQGTHGSNRFFFLDLRNSQDFHAEGCDVTWWQGDDDIESFAVACTYSGISGLRIDQAQELGEPSAPTSVSVSRLVFGATSSVAFANITNSVLITIGDVIVESTRPTEYALFIPTNGTLASRLLFKNAIRSSWVSASATGDENVFGMSPSVIINNDIVIDGSSAPYGIVYPAGGTIKATNCVVGLIVIGSQKDFLDCGTAGIFSGVYSADLYNLSNSLRVNGFISSCVGAGVPASFRGIPVIIGSLALTGSSQIYDLFLVGSITTSSLLVMGNCHITGGIVSTTALSLTSCNITGAVTALNLTAKSTQFTLAVTANRSDLVSCDFLSTLNLSATSNSIIHTITACRIRSGIVLTGATSDVITNLSIDSCNFTGSTTAITYSGLLSTSYTYIDIRNNIPRCKLDTSVPSSCVPQTKIDLDIYTPTATYNLSLAGLAWAFVPSGLTMPSSVMATGTYVSMGNTIAAVSLTGTLYITGALGTYNHHVIGDLY